jgi:hypothetical protein
VGWEGGHFWWPPHRDACKLRVLCVCRTRERCRRLHPMANCQIVSLSLYVPDAVGAALMALRLRPFSHLSPIHTRTYALVVRRCWRRRSGDIFPVVLIKPAKGKEAAEEKRRNCRRVVLEIVAEGKHTHTNTHKRIHTYAVTVSPHPFPSRDIGASLPFQSLFLCVS